MKLSLCDACGCGYVGGGLAMEDLLDEYLGDLGLEADDRDDLRDRILEAHARVPLRTRGARVAGLLASMN